MVLEDFLETSFNTICEDGSPDEIGEIVVTMWRQCSTGDFSSVERTLAQERLRAGAAKQSVGIDGGDVVLSDDEVEEDYKCAPIPEDAEVDEGGDGAMEMDTTPPAAAVSTGPIIDEDGFETVVRRSKRISNKKAK